MNEMFVNTVQFRFPTGAPQPSWSEIAGFVKKLDADVMEMETCYKIIDNKSVYIKHRSFESMQEMIRRNTEVSNFHYDNGKSVEVRMSIAGRNVRYVRVFDLPPEITDNDLSLELGKYGTVERAIREKFPVESGLSHMYTGVRGVYIDVKKAIPPTLVIASRKGRVYYDELRDKCVLCLSEGHRRSSCPSRKTQKPPEKLGAKKSEQENTYAGVVETGMVPSSSEAQTVKESIEILEEENDEAISEAAGQQDPEVVNKAQMDQLCFEKYDIANYTDKLAELRVAVQDHVQKQKSAFKQRRAQLAKSDSIELSPPKKSSRKSST